MMLCERARPAGIGEGWPGLVERERSQNYSIFPYEK